MSERNSTPSNAPSATIRDVARLAGVSLATVSNVLNQTRPVAAETAARVMRAATLTNRVVRLLMWDMPFHAEHHLYPSIPFHRLEDTHRLLRDKLGFVQPGYARWNAGFVRKLAGGEG